VRTTLVKGIKRKPFQATLLIIFVLVFFANLIQNAYSQPVVGNYIDVKVLVFLNERYHVYDLDVNQRIDVEFTFNFSSPPREDFQIVMQTFFSSFKVLEVPSNVTYVYGFWGYPPVGTLVLNLPENFAYGVVRVSGYVSGNSVFFRNTAEFTRLFNVSSPVGYVSSFVFALVKSSSLKMVKIYSPFYTNLPVEEANIEGYNCLVVSKIYPGIPFLIIYEHELWTPLMTVLLTLLILLLIFLPYVVGLIRKSSSELFKVFYGRLRMERVWKFVRNFRRHVSKLNAAKFLSIYIMCAFLMLSLGFVVGPDPRLKVYVLSSTYETSASLRNFVEQELGGVAITMFDETSEFETLTNLGIFSAVIVADFYPFQEKILDSYVYPALYNMPTHYGSIIVLEQYADPFFAQELQGRYGERVIVIKDLNSLSKILTNIPKKTSALGLKIDSSLYLIVATLLGACSLLLFFLALAYLASASIELGKNLTRIGLFEVMVLAVFVFVFTEVIYIVCSVLIAMPLGLHAGGGRITAVGLLGFGGGSTPRMVAGFLGFMLGTFASLKEGLRLGRIGLATFVIIVFFIVVDPLTSGLIFYEFILLYASPYTFETAAATMSYVKNFLSSFGVALGGWVSPTLLISTGIILYYAGAISFFLFPRLRKNTATMLLFFCAFSAASGGIRVSNMRPWDAFMSMLPGIMAGLAVSFIFYGINFAESFIKDKLERRNMA